MKNSKAIILVILVLVSAVSCTVSYSLSSATITPDIKTFCVYDFPNRAGNVNPTLSDDFQYELKMKFNRQTNLKSVDKSGDLEFEGSIIGYDVKPMAIQSQDVAAQSRLTVKIKVKFTNNKNHENDFDTEFSAYADFETSQNLSSVEDDLIDVILDELIEDIFNKSVANW